MASALWSGLGALPPFQFGAHLQAEPTTVALFLACALVAAGVGLAAWARPFRVAPAVLHPLPLLYMANAGIIALLSPVRDAPGLAWLGHPALGEGVAMQLALGALAAGTLVLRTGRAGRLTLLLAAVLAVAGLGTAYQALPKYHAWSPLWTPDFLAFPAIALAAIVAATLRLRGSWAAALAIAGTGLALSDNRTAIAMAAALAAGIALSRPLLRRFGMSLRLQALGLVLALPIATTAALVWTGARLGGENADAVTDPLAKAFSSNWDRALSTRIALAGSSGGTLLTGHGSDAFLRQLAVHGLQPEIRRVEDPGRAVNWTALNWGHYHGHNKFIEALIANGVAGLAATWGVLLVAAARLRPSAAQLIALATYAALACAWFEIPLTQPFIPIALGLAVSGRGMGIVRKGAVRSRQWTAAAAARKRLPAAAAAALVAGLLLASAASVLAVGRQATAALARLPFDRDSALDGSRCLTIGAAGAGDIHLVMLAQEAVGRLGKALKDGGDLPPAVAAAAATLCGLDRRADARDAPQLRLPAALLRADIAYMELPENLPDALAAPIARLLAAWPDRIDALLRLAPDRVDAAIPYLARALGTPAEPRAEQLAESILLRRPGDPVGLWFSGAVRIGDPARASEGYARMVRALDSGLTRHLPISPELAAEVRAAAGAPPAR
ncbi:MAG: hypothetical protein JNK11_00995 [Alphaproteobacteria bacterium]|nr:hypothetical protein [Alphaproteobacteria bacterium]